MKKKRSVEDEHRLERMRFEDAGRVVLTQIRAATDKRKAEEGAPEFVACLWSRWDVEKTVHAILNERAESAARYKKSREFDGWGLVTAAVMSGATFFCIGIGVGELLK